MENIYNYEEDQALGGVYATGQIVLHADAEDPFLCLDFLT